MTNKTEAEVVKNYLQAVENQKKAYEELDKAKFQIRKFMEEKGAEELIDDTKVLTMIKTWDYDKSKLTPILELIPMEDLVSSGAYIPKETRMVEIEEKWDIRILNRFKKRGSDIAELLERIKIPKSFKLTISDRR
tara:strand:+ start:949 stop:1353 length:405 start_codon:yes stop_codon:yes gene_type:complete